MNLVSTESAQQQPDSIPDERACWVCGETEVKIWKERSLERELRPEDFQITDDRYGLTLRLYRCCHCGFVFADDEEVERLVPLYELLEDEEYEETQVSRKLQMQWLLRHVRRHNPSAASLLDIGAGAGLLVAEAGQAGFEATGVEPSRSLVEVAKRIHGVELVQGIFPNPALSSRCFDIIMLVDVIEHVSQPRELLNACRKALTPDGTLVVVTPNINSLAARLLRHRWWHLRLAHVGYFDKSTLERIGMNVGLTAERTLQAKWFFPVEYLATRLEKYLPIAWWNRIAHRLFLFRWLYQRVVPLNLFDSLVVFYRASSSRV